MKIYNCYAIYAFMELNHLRYFYEVARTGSFTKASKTLRVSQPSISKIIKTLEDRESIKLFDRSKNGVTLTEQGKIFFDSCSCIFQEISTLQSTIKSQREECAGDLGVAASDNLCNYILPNLFIGFWKKYPKVRVNLFSGTSESIKSEVLDSRAELGVFYTPVHEPQLVAERLGFVEFVIVCSTKNKMLMKSKQFDKTVLEEAFFIGSRVNDYRKPYPTLQMLQSLGVKPKLFFETNNQETQKKMALQEYGYTIIPRYMVKEELAHKKLSVIRAPKLLGADLFLIKKQKKTLSKPARVFEDFLRKEILKLISS